MNKRLINLTSAFIVLIMIAIGMKSANGVGAWGQTKDFIVYLVVKGIEIKIVMWLFKNVRKAVLTIKHTYHSITNKFLE